MSSYKVTYFRFNSHFRVIFEDGSGRSVSDFLCRNNIFLFLRASVFHFELADSQIFSPEDLYLCQDIAKVFKTLSVLSHSPKVQRSGVPGFPKKEKSLSKKLKSEKSNYEALGNLHIFVSTVGFTCYISYTSNTTFRPNVW